MRFKTSLCALIVISLSVACDSSKKAPQNLELPDITLNLELVADQLQSPVAVVYEGSQYMFVAEQTGKIKAFRSGKQEEQPFLDLSDKLVKISGAYDERGLLGLVLHPEFDKNGKFYVYYSAPLVEEGFDHQSVISEFQADNLNQKTNPASERVILKIKEPESNHNGGTLHFGPDNFLYIGVGDGGGAGDRHGQIGNAQNLNTLLGKILRIDVNSGSPYAIPESNPFVGKDALPEIWAYGLRNPWKFSFDQGTGKMFAADVGQNKWEEVNIIQEGGNYGWRIMEANSCFDPEENCNKENMIPPIAEYSHSVGISVTGGYVYRGNSISELQGKYVFADWTGPAFYLKEEEQKEGSLSKWKMGRISFQGNSAAKIKILSFAQDKSNELYVLTNSDTGPKGNNGAIYKIVNP